MADSKVEADIRHRIWDALSGLYTCDRVWSAWQYGTMREDDFAPAEDDEDVIDNFEQMILELLEKERKEIFERIEKAANVMYTVPCLFQIRAEIYRWKYQVDDMAEVKCPYRTCHWGAGLAGRQKCDVYGNTCDPQCTQYDNNAGGTDG